MKVVTIPNDGFAQFMYFLSINMMLKCFELTAVVMEYSIISVCYTIPWQCNTTVFIFISGMYCYTLNVQKYAVQHLFLITSFIYNFKWSLHNIIAPFPYRKHILLDNPYVSQGLWECQMYRVQECLYLSVVLYYCSSLCLNGHHFCSSLLRKP